MPPLTEEQVIRLETAHDGRDHREEAFYALLENMRAWDGTIGGLPVRIEPDIDALLSDPDAYRGAIVRLSGRIAQLTSLPPPHDGVVETFIRDRENRPLLVYIVLPEVEGWPAELRERSRIEIVARFYKRVDFTARDGRVRQYAAFVGAYPSVTPAAAMGGEVAFLTVVIIAVVMLLAVFVVLFLAIRRSRAADRKRIGSRLSAASVPPELDDTTDLPDDPAEALREMRLRLDRSSND